MPIEAVLRRTLVAVLIGSDERATQAVRGLAALDGPIDTWSALVQLAEAWNLLPSLGERISALSIEIPPEARSALRQRSSHAFLRSMMRARRGVEALQALERHAIPAAAFKGLASMAMLYPSPGMRTIQDADLLVPEPSLRQAIAVLTEAGFRPEVDGDLSGYLAFVANSPGFAGNRSISLSDGAQGDIDLHWRLSLDDRSAIDPAHISERIETATLFGTTIRVVGAVDGLLLTTRHALRNNFSPALICRDLIDSQLWWSRLADKGQAGLALARAKECHLTAPLSALRFIHSLFNDTAQGPEVNEEDQTEASRLADLFLFQLEQGTINQDILYLMQPAALRQILRGLARDWRGYRGFMSALESKSGGAPISLGTRVSHLFSALTRLNSRDVSSLRTLSRAKYR